MASRLHEQIVLITGASSGIGAACARAFAQEGARLILLARRREAMTAAVPDLRGRGAQDVLVIGVDVRDPQAVTAAIDGLPSAWRDVEVLVNNAGLSRGLDTIDKGLTADWDEMIDTNVKGLLYVDRAIVPLMVARGRGTVVHLGSIAGRQVYPGGNVYCASKHAVRALTDGLRLELSGTGVRVTSVDPGLVQDTEFSAVRFHGDTVRAGAVYRGMTPLTAADVAEVIVFTAGRPPHVTLAETLVLPTDQASASVVHRRGESK